MYAGGKLKASILKTIIFCKPNMTHGKDYILKTNHNKIFGIFMQVGIQYFFSIFVPQKIEHKTGKKVGSKLRYLLKTYSRQKRL